LIGTEENETLRLALIKLKVNSCKQRKIIRNPWALQELRDWTLWKGRPPPKRRKEEALIDLNLYIHVYLLIVNSFRLHSEL
jgi:hypothetical protein